MNKKLIGFSIIFSLLCSLMIIINIVFADEWIRPTGHNDTDGRWFSETNIYDEAGTSTCGYNAYTSGSYFWGRFIEFSFPEISSNKLKFSVVAIWYEGYPVDSVDIDGYDGSWFNIYQGTFSAAWNEKSFTERDITKVRFRYYFNWYFEADVYMYDVQIWETAPPDNNPFYSDIGNNGVTQVGEDVTVSCYWEDDFELNWTIVSHNSTGAYVNYTVSCSGNASWSNKTFQLNYTSNIKVGYLFYGQDNASQWNTTSIYYITTTPLYLVFNHNNSTQGRFYVDLVNTANETENSYDYNETVFLLSATYNSSYSWNNFTYSETVITENFYNYTTDGNETMWCNFDVCNATGSGSGEYTEADLHEYFVLGAIISGICVIIGLVVIFDKKDLIRGK